jgi:hypothetical protein
MVKLTKNHSIYEVWCDHAAESVYVLGKPTKTELDYIREKNWPGTNRWGNPHVLRVFKEKRVYTRV